jgi:outer membrane protein assembly factor BamB
VIVADKSGDGQRDIFRCMDANTGRQTWTLTYRAEGEMDFTNTPRATPVIHEGLVYLLGAFGDLHCLELSTGRVAWKMNLLKRFKAERPQWGVSATPLVVGEKLIVNPGAKDASLVALDHRTGDVIWKTPGAAAAYGSFILGRFGGVEQLVGYDAISLGGWDPKTGKRLWRLVPEVEGDFNVPTPINIDGKLLVATENNGTRLYGFREAGRIIQEPLEYNELLGPDTATPVVVNGLLIGIDSNLRCLDLSAGLKTLWGYGKDPFKDYVTFIVGGQGQVLAASQRGDLLLMRPDRTGPNIQASYPLFDDVPETDRDVWPHPALVKNRLYVRNGLGVNCFLLNSAP